MIRSLNVVRKVFCRNKALFIPFLVFLSAIMAFVLYRQIHYETWREYWGNGFDIKPFESILMAALGMYAFFLYIGYELGIRIREADVEETIRPIPGANVTYMGAASLWLVLMAVVGFGIAWLACLSLYAREPVRDAVLLAHLFRGYLMYYFLTPLTGGMMGLAMARLLGARRLAVYPLVLVLVMASTAFLDRTLTSFYYGSETLASAIIPYWIKDWFTVTPYGMGISHREDKLYLIPQELARWLLLSFWMGLSLLTIFVPLINNRLRRWSFVFACVLAVAASAVGFCERGTLVNKDERMVGQGWQEEGRYNAHHPMEAEEGGFTIKDYDIQLKIQQKMKAVVTMELSPLEADRDTYVFTLHRYLKIISLTGENGEKIPYTRSENVLSFAGDHLPTGGKVQLIYSGSFPVYHTNDQSLLLPACFSWYPMAGVRPIAVGGGHNTELPINTTQFRVEVQAPYPVVSNLMGENGYFEGESRGVTLMGSALLKEYQCRGMTFYISRTMNTNDIGMTMLEIDGYLARANIMLNCAPNEPKLIHPAKMYDKVFLLSDQANNYLGSDGYLEQGDHLWMSSAIMSDAEFMVSAYLSGSCHALNQDGWLKSVFINTILERDKRPDVSISDDPEYWLKKLQDFSHADPEAIPITHEIETVLYNCLDYLRMHGDGTELSTIWDRLQTPADECECDEFIFIHDMMKEVMDDVEGN